MRRIESGAGPGSAAGVVLHHIAGRLRLRVAAAKRNPERLERIRQVLAGIEGVRQVSANPALGTMVVEYEPALFHGILARLNEHGAKGELLHVQEPEPEPHPPVTRVDRGLDNLVARANRGLGALTGQTINLKELFPFSILLYSIFFVDKAVAAAQWLSWVQFAFSTYIDVHNEEPVKKVGNSVEALREEIRELRDEIQRTLNTGGARSG